ncbi:MAG TPA: ATP-binding protein [Ktedonobacteraceae bacterium]
MGRHHSFSHALARLSIRWRLALILFGLLVLLLGALSILVSATEEQTLLASQANVLTNEAQLVQTQLQPSKVRLSQAQILTFPEIAKEMSTGMASAIQTTLGQSVGVSLLSFTGNALTTDSGQGTGSDALPAHRVILSQSTVQQWLSARSTPAYLLANDSYGQRTLVILLPIAAWDKTVQQLDNSNVAVDTSGYRKALLQLSMPTTAIDQAVSTTRLILLLGVLAALLIAATLTLPLINLALRPLVEMERVSARIAAGSLSLRLVEPLARDEIGRLASTFNQMVARLEAAFVRQKRFVADVSHELRTPLTGLGGSLEMLLLGADNGDVETSYRLKSGMYSEVERMQRLVVDLLALTRLDDGHLQLRRESLDLHALLCELCEQMQELTSGQVLTCQVAPDLPTFYGDSDQLRRILVNIIENALKFTPAGGRIELDVSSEGAKCIRLEIRDTGSGISPQALPHVFERFYRADPSRSRQPSQIGGSGLGLSIAKELVEAHQGTIAIASQLGVGTTVTMRLPAHAKQTDSPDHWPRE